VAPCAAATGLFDARERSVPMALGIAEIIILGLLVDWLVRRIKLPGLLGMLAIGVLCGPYVCDIFDKNLLDSSQDLRLIALVVILLRAGFGLGKRALLEVGIPAIVQAVLPSLFEIGAVVLLGPPLLGLTWLESAILGAILAAVSTAVVVPQMIDFIETRMGLEKHIPTLILSATCLGNVFVIVVYSVLLGMYLGSGDGVLWKLADIPLSIVTGAVVGGAVGWGLYLFFDKFNPRATKRVLIVLGISILMIHAEHVSQDYFPFSALLAIMTIGVIILEKREHFAHEISSKLGKIWVIAELILFVMVGAQVNVGVVWEAGLAGAALIALALLARGLGAYISLLGTKYDFKERIFIVISNIPKATVQAAIGAAPLVAMKAAGMPARPGEIILAVAVLSIVLTSPIGAVAIAATGKRWLAKAPEGKRYDALDAALESDYHPDTGAKD